ncbi:MAG TPA: AAA family ATPase [Acidimicrobiales bacterium]|nr:AAA family ATPase [Acidimicrobiales bacterium]
MNKTTQRAVRICLDAGVPALLWGGPGIGKSSAVAALAARRDEPIEIVVGSVREPSDFAGLPVVGADGRTVVMAPPAWAERLTGVTRGVLFLDELSTAAPAVQAAMLRVVLDRVVGDCTLPAGVSIVAAANAAEDAADGWDLAPPLANRFCHFEVSADAQTFADGLTLGWETVGDDAIAAERSDPSASAQAKARAEVAGFIRSLPDRLMRQPATAAAAGRAWPSPRTWAMVADVLARVGTDDVAVATVLVTGLVGEGAGLEFLAWRAKADLPDPESVLDDPSGFDWSGRADTVYAVLTGVVGVVAARPTVARWEKACAVLGVAATAGRADVGAAAARALARCRPPKATTWPRSLRSFMPVLAAAGLVESEPVG